MRRGAERGPDGSGSRRGLPLTRERADCVHRNTRRPADVDHGDRAVANQLVHRRATDRECSGGVRNGEEYRRDWLGRCRPRGPGLCDSRLVVVHTRTMRIGYRKPRRRIRGFCARWAALVRGETRADLITAVNSPHRTPSRAPDPERQRCSSDRFRRSLPSADGCSRVATWFRKRPQRQAVAVDAEESRYATAFTGRTASVRTTYERETVSRGVIALTRR